jgi:hypothetical protein
MYNVQCTSCTCPIHLISSPVTRFGADVRSQSWLGIVGTGDRACISGGVEPGTAGAAHTDEMGSG